MIIKGTAFPLSTDLTVVTRTDGVREFRPYLNCCDRGTSTTEMRFGPQHVICNSVSRSLSCIAMLTLRHPHSFAGRVARSISKN